MSKEFRTFWKMKKSSLIAQIKAAVIAQVHHSKEPMKENFSSYPVQIACTMNTPPEQNFFSSVEESTIESTLQLRKSKKQRALYYMKWVWQEIVLFILITVLRLALSLSLKKETGWPHLEFKNKAIQKGET